MEDKKDSLSELVSYIAKNLKKGYTSESLKWALINQGHTKIEVEKALKKAEQKILEGSISKEKEKPKITYQIVEPKEYATTIVKGQEKKPWWKRILGL